MSDGDSTPRTGTKHHTDPEMPSADLLQYQLKELRNGVRESKEQNSEIIAMLGDIKAELKLGAKQMSDHESAIREIRRHGHKATWALISGAGVVAWEFIKHTILGGKQP